MSTKKEGYVASYIHHNGKIGVMVKIYTDTDFCAHTDELKTFGKDLAQQIAFNGEDNLLEQDFIKNPDVKVKSLLDKVKKELKENIVIGSTIRFEI